MVVNLPPIRYLTPEDIQILTRDEFIGMITVRPEDFNIPDVPFWMRVKCPEGVACDCGKCPKWSGSSFMGCDNKDEAELRQKLVLNYLALRRVRAQQHEVVALLEELFGGDNERSK